MKEKITKFLQIIRYYKSANYRSLFQIYFPLMMQLFRYGIVGLTVSAIHFGLVVFLVQVMGYSPLLANTLAYPCSFQFSYWGHRLWTFGGTNASHITAFPKLVMIQIINFMIGQSLFSLFLYIHLPYQVALLIVLAILPIFTFISSRFWVFR